MTSERQFEILADFRAWSGGFEPWECEHAELFAYASSSEVYDFLIAQRPPVDKDAAAEPMHQDVDDDACGDVLLSDAANGTRRDSAACARIF